MVLVNYENYEMKGVVIMEPCMQYELFVNQAFGVEGQCADPAHTVWSFLCDANDLFAIQVSIGYAIRVYAANRTITNDQEAEFLRELASTRDQQAICALIDTMNGVILSR